MDPASLTALILIVGMTVFIAMGVPVAVAIGLPSAVATVVLLGWEGASLASAQRLFASTNSFALLAIPFFVLAGGLMNTGGMAGRLIDFAQVVAGRLPASLAQTTVVANTLFGAVSGASVASAAAVGSVLGPRMKSDGYDPTWSAAVNAASSPTGMLIPPSNTFIVYSLVSGTSVAALFMAGIGPGLLWSGVCVAMVALYARKHPELRAAQRPTVQQALLISWRALPALFMMVVVVGGILIGFFTATESAVIAVVYALAVGLLGRTLPLKALPGVLLEATRTTAIVMLLIGVSGILAFVMSFARIPDLVSDALLGFTENKTLVLLIIMVVLLLAGTVMDPTPAILIFTPIFLPIVTGLGVSPVHFGAMMVFNMCLGNISPPVGNNLFVAARVGGVRVEPVMAKMVPLLIALTLALFVVTFLPQLSLWLPERLGLITAP